MQAEGSDLEEQGMAGESEELTRKREVGLKKEEKKRREKEKKTKT